jgi:hypothetical protein
MKKIHSPYQQEFEPAKIIKVEPLEYVNIEPPKKFEWKPEVKTAEEEYTQTVARNVETMGDLIWRYSPSDELHEKVRGQWLDIMDRMKRICLLCGLQSPLDYSGVYRLDPILQKVLQKELEAIVGRYKLTEIAPISFAILEDYYNNSIV